MTDNPGLLRDLADKEAIRDVQLEYRRCLDAADLAGYAALFTTDGRWYGANMHAVGGPGAVLAMMREHYRDGEPTGDRHVITAPAITLDGNRAHAESTFVVLSRNDEGAPYVRLLGTYRDDLERDDDGRWLISCRYADVDMI